MCLGNTARVAASTPQQHTVSCNQRSPPFQPMLESGTTKSGVTQNLFIAQLAYVIFRKHYPAILKHHSVS